MSIKVGDKFIIEVGTIAELPNGKKKYFIKPFESLVFDKTGLAQLEPIEKAWEDKLAEAKEFAYKNGFEDGNKIADKDLKEIQDSTYDVAYNMALGDATHAISVLENMTETECAEWFEDCEEIGDVVCRFTIQGIIRRTKDYEEKKKAEEVEEKTIKVGDEVICNCPNEQKVIITAKYDGFVTFMRKDGACYSRAEKDMKKTGRHFDEVEQLLDKLRGE